ncbi:MAG: hypothetical protein WD960_08395 [Gemmatimonadota bacterium]
MPKSRKISDNVRSSFLEILEGMAEAPALLADQYRTRLLSQVDVLSDSPEGILVLLENIPRLVDSGIFRGTPWEDPGRLVPSLVGGTLVSGGTNTLLEVLSELRLVAIAEGTLKHRRFSVERAERLLQEILVGNMDLVFPGGTEAERSLDPSIRRKIRSLMAVLLERVPLEGMKGALATELEMMCAQRPIVTDRIVEMCGILHDRVPLNAEEEDDQRILRFVDAVFSPSKEAGHRSLEGYAAFLEEASRGTLEGECRALGESMRDTGLAVAHHALLVRKVRNRPTLLGLALGLDGVGRAELEKHRPFVTQLVDYAIHPETARSCYGLGRILDRALLSRQPVRSGLGRFLSIELDDSARESIEKARPERSIGPPQLLLADCLGVLGQPLGVGQGWNPTCQSARGISLWSQHAPGKLLGMIETAARSGDLTMRFEGAVIRASEVIYTGGEASLQGLDMVSVVLVPLLDRIYHEMMRRTAHRGEDPHKWVNPAMYGHWIPSGFASAYDYATDSIRNYDTFLRTFYATHHPSYNGGHDLAYPNPVGIFLTSATGQLIGFHAVSVRRVRSVRGRIRIYFLNPNNEGRQRWQADIRPAVAGHGEEPGESSLPFHQFASRVYAFHFIPEQVGDISRVEAGDVEKVLEIVGESWAASYRWTDALGMPVATPSNGSPATAAGPAGSGAPG